MTVRDALLYSKSILKKAGVQTPELDAELLLCHILSCNRAHLLAIYNDILCEQDFKKYKVLVAKRSNKVPVSYLIGQREFMGLLFKLNKSVLIPRPETEVLVESVLKELKEVKRPVVLDVGTGSGAIAISIAGYVKECEVYAVDISQDAINIAIQNAIINGVENKVKFFVGDLFKPLPGKVAGSFDVIVSNPPYIPYEDLALLPDDVKYEPVIALNGGSDGLDYYRRIVSGADIYLKKDGILAFEVGYNQARSVLDMMREYNAYIVKDLAGIDRIVIGRRK